MPEQTPPRKAEQPRHEPEIIPPGAADDPLRFRGYAHAGSGQRIYVGSIGPLGVVLIALAIAAVVFLLLLLVLGAMLLWIPIVALLLVGGILSAAYRNYFRRRP